MENIWVISLLLLWVVVLIMLFLLLRVIHALRTAENLRTLTAEKDILPELSLNVPAPDFSARTVSGQLVRLSAYTGKAVAFIFVSPHCGVCRQKLPMLEKLAVQAKERANIDFVLVSDSGVGDTRNWLNIMHNEDGTDITLPMLIAPRTSSDFLKIYNPQSLTPYYCLINDQGIVQARDPLGAGQWPNLQREWQSANTIRPARLYT